MPKLTSYRCISGSKTGTGTVIIVVEDVNDNMPTVPSSELVLCEKEGQLGSVLVVAEDKDQSPLSSPFSFSLPADNDGKWAVERFNGRWLYFCVKGVNWPSNMPGQVF